jgi:hypothetical protein
MVKRDIGHLNFTTSYDLVTKLPPDINGDMELDLIDAAKTQLSLTGNTAFSTAAHDFATYSLTTHFEQKLAYVTLYHYLNDTIHGGTTASIILDHYLGKDQDMLSAKLAFAQPPGPPQGSFTMGWNIGISGAWNITTGQITNYQLDVVKDLHCWEFVGNFTRFGSRWSYDFKLRIKDIPDVAVGKGLFSWALPAQSN